MSKMYDSNSDLDRQIEQLKRCEIIQEHEVKALCAKAREILIEESNVQRVDSPVTVSICLVLLCDTLIQNVHIYSLNDYVNIFTKLYSNSFTIYLCFNEIHFLFG